MTWHEAEQYCDRKGGYLAEPATSQEHDFLRGQAGGLGNTNWWLGMREAEDCQCTRGRTTSAALVDQDDLRNSRNIGYVRTICAPGTRFFYNRS